MAARLSFDERCVISAMVGVGASAGHSPESSTIRVNAIRQELHMAVSVSDDGEGIPTERLPTCFGSSPASTPSSRGATPSFWPH